jgi:hypothetical protein
MPTREEIESEYRAMIAAKAQARDGTRLEAWANGAIFALGWLTSQPDPGAMPPSEGFINFCVPAWRGDLRAEVSSRKDPALP